jgi:hypothetical protein
MGNTDSVITGTYKSIEQVSQQHTFTAVVRNIVSQRVTLNCAHSWKVIIVETNIKTCRPLSSTPPLRHFVLSLFRVALVSYTSTLKVLRCSVLIFLSSTYPGCALTQPCSFPMTAVLLERELASITALVSLQHHARTNLFVGTRHAHALTRDSGRIYHC